MLCMARNETQSLPDVTFDVPEAKETSVKKGGLQLAFDSSFDVPRDAKSVLVQTAAGDVTLPVDGSAVTVDDPKLFTLVSESPAGKVAN